MRVFVAADIPKDVKDYLVLLQNKIGSSSAKIRWVHKKNIHLTIKFLGEVNESLLGKIKERLSNVEFEAFRVRLSNIGVFPSESFARVVWVGLEPEYKVIALQQKVDEALIDIFPNEQKFQAHLTLGRVKFVRRKKDFIDSIKNIDVERREFEISSLSLVKSELTRNGPVYETLGYFKSR